MTHELYNKQPMQMVELKMGMKVDADPHLINELDRKTSHWIIGKYSYINEDTWNNCWIY